MKQFLMNFTFNILQLMITVGNRATGEDFRFRVGTQGFLVF